MSLSTLDFAIHKATIVPMIVQVLIAISMSVLPTLLKSIVKTMYNAKPIINGMVTLYFLVPITLELLQFVSWELLFRSVCP